MRRVFCRLLLVFPIFSLVWACHRTVVLQYSTGGELGEQEAQWLRHFELLNPSIRIRPVKLPALSMSQHDSYVTYLSSGEESVDVFAIDVIWLAEFAESGFIAPLDEYLDSHDSGIYLPSLLKAGVHRDRLYGIPGAADIGLLYRNLRLAKKEGLSEMGTPRMERLLYLPSRPQRISFALQAAFSESLICNLLEFFDATVELSADLVESLQKDRAAWLEALSRIERAVQGTQNLALRMAEPESAELFLNGRALFLRNWPYFLTVLRQKNWRYGEDFDVLPLPERSTIGGWYLVVNAGSPHKKEAAEFIRFMTSEEVQRTNLTAHYEKGQSPGLPSLRALYQNAELRQRFPELKVVEQALKNARARFITPDYYEQSRILLEELHAFLRKKQSAEKALAQIEKRLVGAKGT